MMEAQAKKSSEVVAEKPVLVFLHYFGGASQSWKWVAQLLSDRYECILIDQPGFGTEPALTEPSIQSVARHIAALLLNLNSTSYILIGHSMGGKIAMQIAVDEQIDMPDSAGANSKGAAQIPAVRARQLILIAPSPPSIERMPKEEQLRMLLHPDLKQAKKTVENSTVKSLTAEQQDLAVHTQLIADEATWRWWINEGINQSIAASVKELKIPISVIASKDDPAVTYQMTIEDTLTNLPPHTEIVLTEGIGHLFPFEDAEWTATQIAAIVDRN